MFNSKEAENWADATQTYLEFYRSPQDRLRRELVEPELLRLIQPGGKTILDLGCGEGGFVRTIKAYEPARVIGADIAEGLVAEAKRQDPNGDYRLYDAVTEAVFEPEGFDVVVCNMVLMDVSDLHSVFGKISEFLKRGGRLIVSIQNPYYTFPVGLWKRDVRDLIQGRWDPVLRITDYFGAGVARKNLVGGKLSHYHWKLAQYVNYAQENKLGLVSVHEPKISEALAAKYQNIFLSRQLSRVPLFLILEYTRYDEKK